MKASNLIAFAIGAGLCVTLYACGGSDHTGSTSMTSGSTGTTPVQPSPPAMLTFGVNDVLARAKVQSETDDPFTVTGGSVTPTGDETSDPMSVD
jgi:hypothetical protein